MKERKPRDDRPSIFEQARTRVDPILENIDEMSNEDIELRINNFYMHFNYSFARASDMTEYDGKKFRGFVSSLSTSRDETFYYLYITNVLVLAYTGSFDKLKEDNAKAMEYFIDNKCHRYSKGLHSLQYSKRNKYNKKYLKNIKINTSVN